MAAGGKLQRVFVVGLWCAHPEPGVRPSIVQAAYPLTVDLNYNYTIVLAVQDPRTLEEE